MTVADPTFNAALMFFLAESNAIERATWPTDAEIDWARRVVVEWVPPLINQLSAYAYETAGGVLRVATGVDVRVADHVPPPGGPEIETTLRTLLATAPMLTPVELYHRFEWLHPYTDGNGRTGRLLWAWRQRHETGRMPSSFLAAFHYQALTRLDQYRSALAHLRAETVRTTIGGA